MRAVIRPNLTEVEATLQEEWLLSRLFTISQEYWTPEGVKRRRRKLWTRTEEGRLLLPTGRFLHLTDLIVSSGYEISTDIQWRSVEFVESPRGLRWYQMEDLDEIVHRRSVLLVYPPACGKTTLAREILRCVPNSLMVTPTRLLAGEKTVTYATANRQRKLLHGLDCIIVDEAHHVPAETLYEIMLECDAPLRVGLTATPFRTDGLEALIDACFAHKITRTLSQLREFVSVPKVYVFKTRFEAKVYNWHELVQELIHDERRNAAVVEVTRRMPKPALVLTRWIEHAEILARRLSASLITGQHRGEFSEVTVCTPVAGEGVDLPDLRTVVIAGAGKSPIETLQRVGRVMRPGKEEKYVVDFVDRGPILWRHGAARISAYRSWGLEVTQVKL